MEGKLEKRDVIHQYSNFDSQVYAPMTRIGVYLDSGSEQYNVKSKFNTTLDGAYIPIFKWVVYTHFIIQVFVNLKITYHSVC